MSKEYCFARHVHETCVLPKTSITIYSFVVLFNCYRKRMHLPSHFKDGTISIYSSSTDSVQKALWKLDWYLTLYAEQFITKFTREGRAEKPALQNKRHFRKKFDRHSLVSFEEPNHCEAVDQPSKEEVNKLKTIF